MVVAMVVMLMVVMLMVVVVVVLVVLVPMTGRFRSLPGSVLFSRAVSRRLAAGRLGLGLGVF